MFICIVGDVLYLLETICNLGRVLHARGIACSNALRAYNFFLEACSTTLVLVVLYPTPRHNPLRVSEQTIAKGSAQNYYHARYAQMISYRAAVWTAEHIHELHMFLTEVVTHVHI